MILDNDCAISMVFYVTPLQGSFFNFLHTQGAALGCIFWGLSGLRPRFNMV